MQFQLPKINYDDSDLFFFCFYLLIYLSKLHFGDKNFQTTKATNLKFGQMISLNMKLCTCNFGGVTLHVPKPVKAKFIK